jgi:hypothetical protein
MIRLCLFLAHIGDAFHLHRIPLRARDAAIRRAHWADVCRKVVVR